MIQALLIIGSSVFIAFGTLHFVFTLQDLGDAPRNFTPREDKLRAAMQQARVAFHPKINLWRAWLGFNLSHSFGLLMFGAGFLYVGVFYPPVFLQSLLLQSCAVLGSAIYLLLSLKFWFSKPAIGSGISLGCFVLAAILSYS